MEWTSLFLNTSGKKIFVLGTGEVAERRANKFLESNGEVILSGTNISNELKEKGAILIQDKTPKKLNELVNWSDIVVIASGNKELNEYVSSISGEKLLNRADFPEKGNLIVPTSFFIEDIQISIFTNGKSPLMARELRKKIQKSIPNKDILQIKLQDYARKILKQTIDSQKDRKEYLYKILNDKHINDLLEDDDLNEAKTYVKKLIDQNNE